MTIVAATAFHVLRDAQLRLPASILALEVAGDGRLSYLTRAEGWCEATVHDDSFVTPSLTVLILFSNGRRFPKYLILLSDSGNAEMFRRLRIWLRWGCKLLMSQEETDASGLH